MDLNYSNIRHQLTWITLANTQFITTMNDLRKRKNRKRVGHNNSICKAADWGYVEPKRKKNGEQQKEVDTCKIYTQKKNMKCKFEEKRDSKMKIRESRERHNLNCGLKRKIHLDEKCRIMNKKCDAKNKARPESKKIRLEKPSDHRRRSTRRSGMGSLDNINHRNETSGFLENIEPGFFVPVAESTAIYQSINSMSGLGPDIDIDPDDKICLAYMKEELGTTVGSDELREIIQHPIVVHLKENPGMFLSEESYDENQSCFDYQTEKQGLNPFDRMLKNINEFQYKERKSKLLFADVQRNKALAMQKDRVKMDQRNLVENKRQLKVHCNRKRAKRLKTKRGRKVKMIVL
ncbi:hypothetical protein ACOME3_000037 [Neoechinorhynchus agilis]